MITIGNFAKKTGLSRDTIYSWIYRNKLEKLKEAGVKLIRLEGKGFMLEEIKKR